MLSKGSFWGGVFAGLFVGMVIVWGAHILLVGALGVRPDAAGWLYRPVCFVLGVGVLVAGLRTKRQADLRSTGMLLVGSGVGLALLALLSALSGLPRTD